MNSPQFKVAACKSLDPDLVDLTCKNLCTAAEAIILQQLRIFRGRPFNVDLNAPDQTGHWSPDGKEWLPKAPGT